MFFTLFLIFERYSNIKASIISQYVAIESFGFEAGGDYSFSISESSQPIIFGVLSKENYTKFKDDESKTPEKYCPVNGNTNYDNISSIQQFFNVSDPTKTISGEVPTKGIYYFFSYGCIDSKYNIKYSYEFSNPKTKLDYRDYPSMIEYPIAIVIFAGLLIVWLINWFMNFRLKIYIHFILTAVFALALISSCARYGAISYASKNHNNRAVESAFIVFDLLYSVTLFIFVLLAAKGWCIIRETIRFSELILAISFTVIYLILQTISTYVSFGKYDIIVIILMLIAICLYVHQLISAINSASLHIRAHLLAIQNAGIDAKTTPVWQKNLMYNMLQWSIIVFLILIIIHIVIVYFFPNYGWVDGFIYDIQNIVCLILLGINFRLRGPDAANGYTMIEEPDGTNEFAMSDIERIDVNSAEFQQGGKQWESGMPLPAPPQVVETPSIVTIESPDGTTDIIIQPGKYQA
ncbi:hypothetical protein TRFO_24664 [Tritrichomonas foetus]|uniref:Intimal thickness related receptor IRP domain-containing protein n=1 Tax=Tritrichomonas foetus TaxID=1144522 RepID=A0A1J4K790_9EUKA|nr:hypothetical protein TRFO_24664 [Tritrichomonas foetus]|eukprot:OHT07255.1 hypothetical protein TRFO_24664 [Tritrichomonas foetus]